MPDGLSSIAVFYVYEHWRPDSGLCFYVGKGTKKRARRMGGRNVRHLLIQEELKAKNLQVEVRLVRSFLDEREAFAFETERINHYPIGQLVNMTEGGEGMSNPSPEARAKMAARMLGQKRGPHTLETRRKMSEALRGRKLSAETRAKMSASQKGRIITEEARAKLRAKRLGMKFGPEFAAKISASKTGKKRAITSPEARAALSRALMGHPVSEETRAKLRAFNLGRKRLLKPEGTCQMV